MMQITSGSPLQLEAVNVTKLAITFNEEASFAGKMGAGDSLDEYNARADFDVYHTEDETRQHLVVLELVIRNKKEASDARFTRLEIKLRGIFTPHPGFEEEVIRQVIPGNCLAILHGIARGIVLTATSACHGGSFLLPVINYQDLIAKKTRAMKRKQAAQEESLRL